MNENNQANQLDYNIQRQQRDFSFFYPCFKYFIKTLFLCLDVMYKKLRGRGMNLECINLGPTYITGDLTYVTLSCLRDSNEGAPCYRIKSSVSKPHVSPLLPNEHTNSNYIS